MTALRVGWAIGFPLLVGLALTRAAPAVWTSPALRWGLAFGLGSGFLTVEMFLFARLGLAWSPLRLAILPAACGVAALVRGRPGAVQSDRARPPVGLSRRAARAGLGLILASLIGAAVVQATLVPVSTWDGFAIWGFKARAFYQDGTVSPGFFLESSRGYSHPDYPLHLSLLMAWVFLVLGQWHDGLVGLLFPVYYASLLLVAYGALAREGSSEGALLITTAFASLPQLLAHASAAMADLLLAYCLVATVALVVISLERADRRALVVAAVMGGLGGWTKNEGMALFAVVALCLGLWIAARRRDEPGLASRLLLFGAAGGAVMLPWLLWRASLGLETHLVSRESVLRGLIDAPTRLTLVGAAIAAEAARVSRWNLLWLLFLLATLLAVWSSEARSARRYALVAWSGMGLYILLYLVTDRDLPWLLSTSLDRLLLHVAPLAVLTIGSVALGARPGD